MPPELSVVIPTHERRAALRMCLDSFERQTAPADAFEVVVVVDGSTDGTEEMLSQLAPSFDLAVLVQPQAGASAARNRGAGRARGRVLLFVDDDMRASPQLVAAHLSTHREQGRTVGLGLIARGIPAEADRFARLRADASEAHFEHLRTRPPTYLDCYGGNFSLPRMLFTEVGGFSPELPVLNDLELAHRLDAAGARFDFIPDAAVTEDRRDDWSAIVADRELRGRVAAGLLERDPAILRGTELGGFEPLRGFWRGFRGLCLALRVPARTLARVGLLLPRGRWSSTWFAFVFSYAYRRGAARAAGRGDRRAVT